VALTRETIYTRELSESLPKSRVSVKM
jgi:hypothetical protein